jgi:nicotinate-nucleotide adenylyltransferase
MKIALFGGSFDPPHIGHQMVCLYVLATEPIDELWFVPVFAHAFGKPLTPFAHRLEMCKRVCEPFGSRVKVSEVERELGGVSRTAETVRHLQRQRPGDELSLVIGADVLGELQGWYDADALRRLVQFIIIGRTGYERAESLPMPAVSSSDVRRRLAAGEPCQHLVPRNVLAYIAEHGLYR